MAKYIRNCDGKFRNLACVKTRKAFRSGFSYVALLILIGILSVTAALGAQVGSILQRRNAEQELLAIAREYRQALLSYAISTPAGTNTAPKTLEDLLKDNRFPSAKRHLRKIYIDPITGENKWGLILNPSDARIIGIHSLSTLKPIKVDNFESGFEQFANKGSYQDWIIAIAH